MKSRNAVLLAGAWALPASTFKNRILCRLGHKVDPTAHAGPNLIWRVENLELAPGSRIRHLNVIKNVRSVRIGRDSSIGKMNLVSSHPAFTRLSPGGSSLTLADHVTITSHHSIDCAGPVTIGSFSLLAGKGSTIMTHSIDVGVDAQTTLPVSIGERSFISTSVLILGGSVLPTRSLLAAGAVLVRSGEMGKSGLWAGVPARRIGKVEGAWFDREQTHTRRIYLQDTEEMVEEAF